MFVYVEFVCFKEYAMRVFCVKGHIAVNLYLTCENAKECQLLKKNKNKIGLSIGLNRRLS